MLGLGYEQPDEDAIDTAIRSIYGESDFEHDVPIASLSPEDRDIALQTRSASNLLRDRAVAEEYLSALNL